MADSTYVFRDSIENDLQRKQDAALGGFPSLTPPTTAAQSAMPAAPAQPVAPALPTAPQGQAQSANPFEAFSKALEAQSPFKQQVQKSVQGQLDNPYQAVDAANAAARDKMSNEANAAQEETRGQAISAYGGYQTGQAPKALDQFREKRLLADQSFNLNAAANRAQVGEQVRSNAIGQGANLLGQEQQAAATAAGLLDSSAGRASQEKVAFAGLSQQDRQLAQQAGQFASQQDFEKWATQGGWDQSAIQRSWQANESDKAIKSQEQMAASEIGSKERMQGLDQIFQTSENNKNRILESMLSTDRIKAQFDLANLDGTIKEKLQNQGYIQSKDLQLLKQDFENELTDKGIAADIAKQLSDQKFKGIEAENDRTFNANQNDIKMKWETGERMGTQDWQASMKDLDRKQEDLIQERDIAAKQGMNTNQLETEIQKVQMQINSQELMSTAQLLQNDNEFRQEIMLKKNISEAEIGIARQKLGAELEGLGLEKSKLEYAMKNDKVKNAIELATWGMEMGNGSEEAMAPFIAQLGNALKTTFDEAGVTEEEFKKAFTKPTVTTTGTTNTAVVTAGTLTDANLSLSDIQDTLKPNADITDMKDSLSAVSSGVAGRNTKYDSVRIKTSNPIYKLAAKMDPNGSDKRDTSTHTSASGNSLVNYKTDYLAYTTYQYILNNMAVPDKEKAMKIASGAVGEDSIKKGFKLINGKDWS